MKEKILFYAMEGEKMCFMHAIMNALDLKESGHDVKLILEGAACKLHSVLRDENNPLYKKLLDSDILIGVCLACSKMLGVYEKNKDIPFLDDMNGHAGMKPWIEKGYKIIAM